VFIRAEAGHATDLKGTADLLERVAVAAHGLAGTRNVSQFLRELEQRERFRPAL
jgi:hypothetical protein